MSHEAEKHEDHGTELKKILDEVQNSEGSRKPHKTHEPAEPAKKERQIDVLNLPPRKDVHSGTKNRTRVKINNALFRLIFVIILTVLGLGGLFYLWGEEVLKIINF